MAKANKNGDRAHICYKIGIIYDNESRCYLRVGHYWILQGDMAAKKRKTVNVGL